MQVFGIHAITIEVLINDQKLLWGIKKHLLSHMTHLQLVIMIKIIYKGARGDKVSDLVKALSK